MGIETGALLAYAAAASAAVGAGTAVYQGEQQKKALKQQAADAEAARAQQQQEIDLAREQISTAAAADRAKPKNPIASLFGARGGAGGGLFGGGLPTIDPQTLLGGGLQLPGLGLALGQSRLLGR